MRFLWYLGWYVIVTNIIFDLGFVISLNMGCKTIFYSIHNYNDKNVKACNFFLI